MIKNANTDSYKPRLIIENHFDSLVNRVNVKTEELLQRSFQDESKSVNNLNEIKLKQIMIIEEVKEINLKSLENMNEEENFKKISELVANTSLKYQDKIDQIKEEIISVDCIILENNQLFHTVINGLDLWITPWFYNARNLEILK